MSKVLNISIFTTYIVVCNTQLPEFGWVEGGKKYLSILKNQNFVRQMAQICHDYFQTEPPGAPGEPSIVDFDNKSVTLRWAKPKDTGGRPISHYIIQKKDKFGGWFDALITDDLVNLTLKFLTT
jgi:hypothetical protein